MAEAYGRWAEPYLSVLEPTLKPMAEQLLRLGHVSAAQCVLDVATGTGLITRAAAATGARVVAIDISTGALAVAHLSMPKGVSFVAADAVRLPFAGQRFHLATCGLAVSHFGDASSVLSEIRRVLCPGGMFVASCWGSSGSDPSFSAAFSILEKRAPKRSDLFGSFRGLPDRIVASGDEAVHV